MQHDLRCAFYRGRANGGGNVDGGRSRHAPGEAHGAHRNDLENVLHDGANRAGGFEERLRRTALGDGDGDIASTGRSGSPMTRPPAAMLAQVVAPAKQGQSPATVGFGLMPTIPWNMPGVVASGESSVM